MLENLHAAATWYLVGLIWLVQLVQYPMFAHLDRASFLQAHAFHSTAIGMVVAPPMVLELALAVWFAAARGRDPLAWAGLALVLAIWAATAFLIVPLHGQLGSAGFDADVHARLVSWNWIRTAAWTLRGAIAFAWLR